MPDTYDRTEINGHKVNYRTLEILTVTAHALGFMPVVVKGSYVPADAVSSDTHAGGGAVDIRTYDLSDTSKRALVRTLRHYAAAWYRYPPKFAEHVHAIMIGDRELSAGARQQVAWYFQGLNGLWSPSQGPDEWPSDTTATLWRQTTKSYPQTLQILDDMNESEYKQMQFFDLTTATEGDTVGQKTITQNNYRRILRTYEGVQKLLTDPPAVPVTLSDEQLAKLSDMLADNLAARLAD